MSALLILPLFIVYFISLSLALAPKTKYVTKSTLIYETVHPVVTVYVTDEAQCSSLGLPLCHKVLWASNSCSSSQLFFLSTSDSTAALILSDNQVTTTSTSFHGATTTTTTATKNSAIGESETLDSNSFSTKINAVNTKNRVLTSQGSVAQSASTAPGTTSSNGPTTTITTTESIGEEIDLDSSSSDNNIPSSPLSSTHTTINHHSPFMLESAGSDHFVQFGPEGTIIIGPVILDSERAVPPMFILHHHGYLTSEDDPNDIVFLRSVDQNQTQHERDKASEYFKVIHGPKTNISFDDLTSRFSIKDGFLEFFEQGQNNSRFDCSDDEAISKTLTTGSNNEDASNDSSSLPLSKSRLTKCPKTPNPTQVWKIVRIIAQLDLRNYCSNLLGYKSPATVVKTKAGSTLIVTVNITGDEKTEVETSTYYTGTATVAFSTVYNAGEEPEKRRVQSTEEKTVSGVTYLVVDKSSYDGVYGKEDDGVLTKVGTGSNTDADIDYPMDSPDKTPPQLASFCEIDISEACSQIVAPSEPTTITKTNKGKTLTLPLTDAPTKTETKVLLAAATTTVLNTTQISYPGAGRLTVDSGTYNRWYLYWTGDTLDPALCLLLPSTNATFFITEYRPNMETYRVYTNGPNGEKYYMSIAAPIGISAVTDYSISLKTLNDINSDEGSVLLYVDLNLENGYVNINTEITGTDRNTMFGCVMVMGKELRTQVRLYAVGDGTVPRECQAWSNLILI
ncbi:hypothetical protein TWF703_001321 [Orbilia oligospora]|uniref:Uncharacterized protein n=1 Tax=Orbilia oligospora TaxID=2813651 RepID=A0A7C8JZL5_ORBOL|nr:hypothetical protein TWF703_001321 [Orbilia oligospora]